MCDPAEVFYLYNGDADDPAAALMRHLSSEHLVKSFSLFSHSFDGKSFNLTNLIGRENFLPGAGEEETDDPEANGNKCVYCGTAFDTEDSVRAHVAAEHAAGIERDQELARCEIIFKVSTP